MKKLFFFLFFVFSAYAADIRIHNKLLAKIDGRPISILDIKKKMDFLFYKSYPKYKNNLPAKYEFYRNSWKGVLMELINEEMLCLEAEKKELKVTTAEVKEEIKKRFGTDTMQTLQSLDLTYEEAFDFVKKDIMVERMIWLFIHPKALKPITPQVIKNNYKIFLKENPEITIWDYQVLSISADDKKSQEECAKILLEKLQASKKSIIENEKLLKEMEKNYPDISLKISPCTISSKEASTALLQIFNLLQKGTYSNITKHISRIHKKEISKIFYLKDVQVQPPPSFEKQAPVIKNKLFKKAFEKEYSSFLKKLHNHYSLESFPLPKEFQPFFIQ